MHILLSYPRSGNHLVRFFIELLSEKPTFGGARNKKDIPIHKNIFSESIPFNISKDYIKSECYHKIHSLRELQMYYKNTKFDKLILIVRNPREVLLRNTNFIINEEDYNKYFESIDYYLNYTEPKKIFYYENILSNKTKFINDLYNFLEINNAEKLSYCLENCEKLFDLSANGQGRDWGGVKSNSFEFYYPKLTDPENKKKFDDFLNEKFSDPKYLFLTDKYNI